MLKLPPYKKDNIGSRPDRNKQTKKKNTHAIKSNAIFDPTKPYHNFNNIIIARAAIYLQPISQVSADRAFLLRNGFFVKSVQTL